ncbi:MAG: hypothetical protein CMI08_07145 [Oceanospirillaceae bacterium]|uniref:hypothetical protein n=1 Tax=unclassified Thalassolituus TaxID=2624967 RepID=UPI000C65CF80|nr:MULTISPECIES: hypothetical protein [unclassified Thalassolituus]MAS24420.1 hypothetical protein [Oceanospirillaceae bacterium]MAX98967.1 hypothetical protein [Oceanospirillaceae bacterium]MBL35370.1 hypothetical protein [Oceanospirillaceae bacterium]MBS54861.1 hypothetical protein [Oceanospirillaceae bacterium]
MSLLDYLGHQVLGVAAAYASSTNQSGVARDNSVYIGIVDIHADDCLTLYSPSGHGLQQGDRITLHLDNRTGVSEYDAELQVYRLSYKGQVAQCIDKQRVRLMPREFQVMYGISVVYEYRQPGYRFPQDLRSASALPETPMTEVPAIDHSEHDNKIGVLITAAEEQPHTTVMAFLSSVEDDIFFITFPQTFKSQLMKRNNNCFFAIDSRATFTFEEAVEWNYSIIQGKVYDIPRSHPAFSLIQELFIAKNPWEMAFFSNPEVEMFHLKPEHVICPGPRPK